MLINHFKAFNPVFLHQFVALFDQHTLENTTQKNRGCLRTVFSKELHDYTNSITFAT